MLCSSPPTIDTNKLIMIIVIKEEEVEYNINTHLYRYNKNYKINIVYGAMLMSIERIHTQRFRIVLNKYVLVCVWHIYGSFRIRFGVEISNGDKNFFLLQIIDIRRQREKKSRVKLTMYVDDDEITYRTERNRLLFVWFSVDSIC